MMVGLRERNRRRTKQDIADAALRLFAERGLEQTSADRIAEQAGVSRSTFFRYFPTKAHTLFPDHDTEVARFRASVTAKPMTGGRREAVLAAARDAGAATIEAFRRDPHSYRLRHQILASTPSARELSLRLDLDWEDAFTAVFQRLLSDDRHGTDLPARLLAGSLMGIVRAFHRLWAEEGFERDPGEYLDAVMAVFEGGLHAALQACGEAGGRVHPGTQDGGRGDEGRGGMDRRRGKPRADTGGRPAAT